MRPENWTIVFLSRLTLSVGGGAPVRAARDRRARLGVSAMQTVPVVRLRAQPIVLARAHVSVCMPPASARRYRSYPATDARESAPPSLHGKVLSLQGNAEGCSALKYTAFVTRTEKTWWGQCRRSNMDNIWTIFVILLLQQKREILHYIT